MHFFRRCTHFLHPQSCYWHLVLENLLQVLEEEVVLVQSVESLKKFQAHFEGLHRLHLNPWAFAFWPSAIHSAAFLQEFSFPFDFVDPVSVDFPFEAVTLNDHPRDFVVPRLLNLHPCLG